MNDFEYTIDPDVPHIPIWVFDGLKAIAASKIYNKYRKDISNEAFRKLQIDAIKGGRSQNYVEKFFLDLKYKASQMSKRQLESWWIILAEAFHVNELDADHFIRFQIKNKDTFPWDEYRSRYEYPEPKYTRSYSYYNSPSYVER